MLRSCTPGIKLFPKWYSVSEGFFKCGSRLVYNNVGYTENETIDAVKVLDSHWRYLVRCFPVRNYAMVFLRAVGLTQFALGRAVIRSSWFMSYVREH